MTFAEALRKAREMFGEPIQLTELLHPAELGANCGAGKYVIRWDGKDAVIKGIRWDGKDAVIKDQRIHLVHCVAGHSWEEALDLASLRKADTVEK